jgi:hypothetical protein
VLEYPGDAGGAFGTMMSELLKGVLAGERRRTYCAVLAGESNDVRASIDVEPVLRLAKLDGPSAFIGCMPFRTRLLHPRRR